MCIRDRRFASGQFDVGPLSADLSGLPGECDVAPKAPRVLMPVHLELLSYTNPEPARAPEVAGFLHGEAEPDSDVSVLWRSDLDGIDEQGMQRLLELLPPAAGELIEVPIGAARRWLAGAPPVPVSSEPLVSPRVLREIDRIRSRLLRWVLLDALLTFAFVAAAVAVPVALLLEALETELWPAPALGIARERAPQVVNPQVGDLRPGQDARPAGLGVGQVAAGP